ncbi:MAG: tyrosine-type recombinase/integrase [Vicinamibacterales bacterium]
MLRKITVELTRKLPTRDVDIRDTKLTGFMIRCRATGRHVYRVQLGRARAMTIGPVAELTPEQARDKAWEHLNADKRGLDPVARKRAEKARKPFSAFLDDDYEPWVLEHHKRGAESLRRLRTVFAELNHRKLDEITAFTVESWRTKWLKSTGAKPATVNSYVTTLRAALSRAVEWGMIPAHPLKSVKQLKEDKTGRVRFLSAAEETRLRDALAKRDEARKARREKANAWRRARGYAEYDAEGRDHVTAIVLLALNTGLRKGEVFNLGWADVDLLTKLVTVRGEGAKSGQTRYVNLNDEALAVLKDWRKLSGGDGYVFPGRVEGKPLEDIKHAWGPLMESARITNFTIHDLRHTFASNLVMAGVDLNTVRELLGHADIKMTLRYAHLAPEHKAAAVQTLMRRVS